MAALGRLDVGAPADLVAWDADHEGAFALRLGAMRARRIWIGGTEVVNELQSSVGTLVGQGGAWFLAFLKSLWTGSQALVSIASLLVVTPVVAFYVLHDWDRMIATIDGWLPPGQRDDVLVHVHDPGGGLRRLEREADVGGLVLAVVGLGVLALWPPFARGRIALEVLASATWWQNWLLVDRATDYLATGTTPSPLQPGLALPVV